jgi:hypothetical protein
LGEEDKVQGLCGSNGNVGCSNQGGKEKGLKANRVYEERVRRRG